MQLDDLRDPSAGAGVTAFDRLLRDAGGLGPRKTGQAGQRGGEVCLLGSIVAIGIIPSVIVNHIIATLMFMSFFCYFYNRHHSDYYYYY